MHIVTRKLSAEYIQASEKLVEFVFSSMCAKWRLLLDPVKTEIIVKRVRLLFNIISDREGIPQSSEAASKCTCRRNNRVGKKAHDVREEFKK